MGVYPVLLAAYAVLFLWSQNVGEVRPGDVVVPLVLTMVVAGGLTWLAGRILGDRRRGALVVAPIIVGALMYGHAANLARPLGIPGLVQQVGWVALVVLTFIVAVRLDPRRLGLLDTFLTRVSTVLVVVALALIVPTFVGALGDQSAVLGTGPLATETTAPKRDVYYLIFDRYGSDRSFELRDGIENDLTPWLEGRGFTTLPDSHANYVRTTLSLATTLNMRHLDELLVPLDPDSRNLRPLEALLAGPTVPRQFQALGYRYIHVGSWYDATNLDPVADVNLNMAGTSDFLAELYAASAGPALTSRLRLGSLLPSHNDEHYQHGRYELDALEGLVDEPGPKFVFGHVLLPHSPYVFDSDGSQFTPDEMRDLSDRERSVRQLAYTNARIRALVDELLALPEERRPIIIVQADEGPYSPGYSAATRDSYDWSTASPKDLEIKYGILNAWYLPDGEEPLGLSPSMTAINTFPVLFDRYFGLDYPMQADRIQTSKSWRQPYDLTDVTDRLPAAP